MKFILALRFPALFASLRFAGKSGGGPPQSKTLARNSTIPMNAKRLGLRQSSGAFDGARRHGTTGQRRERGAMNQVSGEIFREKICGRIED